MSALIAVVVLYGLLMLGVCHVIKRHYEGVGH